MLAMQRQANDLDLDKCTTAVATCACFNFRKASRALTQYFDDALQPAGLRSTQLVLLMGVAVNDGCTSARLARELVLDRSTLARNLKPLVRRGLLKMLPGEDRRTLLITLTKRGRSALAESIPLWEEAQARFVERMGSRHFQRVMSELPRTVSSARVASST